MLPKFLLKRIPKQQHIRQIRELINDAGLQTVCEAAKCPNIGECFAQAVLTFLILGDRCTRRCRFCAVPAGRQGVTKGFPLPAKPDEPARIVAAVKKLRLDYVVITSVSRDDLPDGGAKQFAKVIAALQQSGAAIKVEVLIPDFQGNELALKTVLDAGPYVLNHNIETVPRLYPSIRPQADYQRSLELLRSAKSQKSTVYTKSGFMVGLGERHDEIRQVLEDLKASSCDLVTIGQYLPPSKAHPKADRYVQPDEFKEYARVGEELGLKVIAGPFVRSSYQAKAAIGIT